MAQTEQVLRKSYASSASVEVGKFTVAKLDTSNVGQFVMSSSAYDGPVAGVATESLIPDNYQDYSSGTYNIPSGSTWPSNVVPSSSAGKAVSFAVAPSIIRCIAASGIAIGDRVAQASTTTINSVNMMGAVKKLDQANLTTGTYYEVGEALTAGSNAGDVIRVRLTMNKVVIK
jgi:hypothetical protein